MSDTFGRFFTLTTFGESHGLGLGGVVQGCPAGIPLSEEMIQKELDKRRPGQGISSTSRKEKDRVKLLSGVFEGKTTGTAIGFYIANEDQRSRDYSKIKDVFRPGHGDYTYTQKFGIRDYRGGGRSSGRETVSRVAGGAIAQEVLRTRGIQVFAYTVELGGIPVEIKDVQAAEKLPFFSADKNVVSKWEQRIREVRAEGDTLGGIVEIMAIGVPAGLGEPVFDKLDARLAYALMGVGAVKGVEIGRGFDAPRLLGSENNDPITPDGFKGNNSGGVLAGISSGQPIICRAAVKPIPSIARPQQTINKDNQPVEINIGGRHDICAIPRIVPVLKAMVLLTLADMLLLHEARSSWVSG
ncbi:chorismate synthase [Desulfovulcanus sp.]